MLDFYARIHTMKKLRFLLSFFALLLGGAVVAISLMSASTSLAYRDDHISKRRLYLAKEILPDNLFYPVLAVSDRARLEMATPVDRVYLKIDYSHKRLGFAKQLLINGETQLAQSTLTKSQKYLNSAMQDILLGDFSLELKKHVLASADYHLSEQKALFDAFLPQQKTAVESLRDETMILREKLGKE